MDGINPFTLPTHFDLSKTGGSLTPTHTWNDEYFRTQFFDKSPKYKWRTSAERFSQALLAWDFWVNGGDDKVDEVVHWGLLLSDPAKRDTPLYNVAMNDQSEKSIVVRTGKTIDLARWTITGYTPAVSMATTGVLTAPKQDMTMAAEDVAASSSGANKLANQAVLGSGTDVTKIHAHLSGALTDDDKRDFADWVGLHYAAMMRAVTRTQTSVLGAYSTRLAENFQKTYSVTKDVYKVAIPPTQAVFDKLYAVINSKIQQSVINTLSIMVQQYANDKSGGSSGLGRLGVLNFTNIIHIGFNGLGMLKDILDASDMVKLPAKTLNRMCAFGPIGNSSKRLQMYFAGQFEGQAQKDERYPTMSTLPFCRLFDNSQYADFNRDQNLEYCLTMAFFLSGKNETIFQAQAFKTATAENLKNAEIYYKAIVKTLSSVDVASALTDEARKVASQISGVSDPPAKVVLGGRRGRSDL